MPEAQFVADKGEVHGTHLPMVVLGTLIHLANTTDPQGIMTVMDRKLCVNELKRSGCETFTN
jgi:hypothetical protein